ncbi:MAG TPA: ChbG/HpnK family deacetylase [Burkholderiaceae bacterium]|nr:ChbG/HpnK family deacetylase [Burkholderiaceae bacterium]
MIAAAAVPPSDPEPRHWISCADDFAIDEGAVDGILELIERGRITATSALVDSPLWQSSAQQLRAQLQRSAAHGSSRADVGLHLNLTQAFAGQKTAVWPLAELMARCALRAVPRPLLHRAIEHQLDAFEEALGQRPDYVDGHQHVHQFAVVREALVGALRRRYGSRLPWVRSTRPPAAVRDLKARGIAALGDRRLRELAAASQLATNAYLVGVYDFRADARAYWMHLERWVREGPEATVLMSHPALRSRAEDPLAAARPMEFAALASAQFGVLLERAHIALTTGTQLLGRAQVGPAERAGALANG